MDQKERMLNGLPYDSFMDGLFEDRAKAKKLLKKFNDSERYDVEEMHGILSELLGAHGERFFIEPPFRCDYGYNIELGENFYANYNFSVLDCAKVKIGDNVLIGPNVCLTAAGHPIHPALRLDFEYAFPITIGNNVWIGANVVVNPGVTIGENSVIGSGSVVTKDVPANVVAVGNPCRVLREITERDKEFYFKDKRIDPDDPFFLMERAAPFSDTEN